MAGRRTQAQASSVLGGGPNAFQKYESGIGLPSKAISNLLRVLAVDPRGLEILRPAARRVKEVPRFNEIERGRPKSEGDTRERVGAV